LGTGIDVSTFVADQMSALSEPVTLLQNDLTTLSTESTMLAALNSGLSTLQTDVQAFTDLNGTFNAKTATSSDTTQLNATASGTAASGTHTIVVTQLASNSSYYTTTSLASGSTTFGTGTFYIKVGNNTAVPITVTSSNDTLNGLANTINNTSGLGVTASVYTDANGAHLSLVSQNSGLANSITINPDTNTTGLSFQQGAAGQDALLTVDGISIDSSSNTISSVISGVTLNLTGADKDDVTLTVAPDVSSMTTAVNDFVSDYNTLINAINNQFAYNPSTDASAPLLQDDDGLQMVQEQLYADANYAMTKPVDSSGNINDGIVNLQSLGITMNDNGTLTVDSSTLTNALTSNPTAVQNFFQGSASSGVSWGQNFNNNLYSLTDPVSGVLNVELNGITQNQSSLNSQISDMEANLAVQQQNLVAEYSSMNTVLEELPETLSSINSQLSGLNG
jgi:flagellar hook-associated protein 2